ncbi:MAG: MFS transporter, partial [Desulfovibrionaceae bacterium]
MGRVDTMQQRITRWKPFYASDNEVPSTVQQKILFVVACLGGMLPICNLAMISSSYLVLSGDLNADFADLARLVLTNILIMSIVQPLVNYVHAWLGLRSALLLSHVCIILGGIGAASATTLLTLSLCYSLMGLGSGLFMSLSVRIIATIFPPQARKILIAVWTFSIGFGSNASPALAGYLVEFLTWHSLFLMGPLFVLPCFLSVLLLLPDHSLPKLPPFDGVSLLFLLIFSASTLLAICYGQLWEWNSNLMIAIMFIGASALLLCVISSCSTAHPLLNIKALRYKGVVLALIAAIFAIVVHVGIRVEMILFMRNVLNYPPSQIGMMYIIPLCIFMCVLIPVGIILTTHDSGKMFALIGFGIMFTAALLLSRLDSHPSWFQITLPLSLSSIGFAMSSASMTSLLLRNVPSEVHPSLLVVINAVRFLGICISVGILAPFSTHLNTWYLSRLASQATDASSAMTSSVAQWTSIFLGKGISAAAAHHNSLAMVTSSLKKQAIIFSYNHLFLYLALVACLGFCCLLLCRRQGARPG